MFVCEKCFLERKTRHNESSKPVLPRRHHPRHHNHRYAFCWEFSAMVSKYRKHNHFKQQKRTETSAMLHQEPHIAPCGTHLRGHEKKIKQNKRKILFAGKFLIKLAIWQDCDTNIFFLKLLKIKPKNVTPGYKYFASCTKVVVGGWSFVFVWYQYHWNELSYAFEPVTIFYTHIAHVLSQNVKIVAAF